MGRRNRQRGWGVKYINLDRPEPNEFGVIGALAWRGNIYNTNGNGIADQEHMVSLSERERFLGNYEPGRKAIHLLDVVRLEKPLRVRGSQGCFNFTVSKELHKVVLAIAEKHQ